MRTLVLILLALSQDYTSIKTKFAKIEKQNLPPGTRISLTQNELNAYVQRELPQVAPKGIRNPKVVLEGNNTATGKALIDFVQLRNAQGRPPGLILRTILSGEHEMQISATIRSAQGKATVTLNSVTIEGIPISGAALDFLIENYLLPNYPDAKVNRPFDLHYRIDRIEVTRTAAIITTR